MRLPALLLSIGSLATTPLFSSDESMQFGLSAGLTGISGDLGKLVDLNVTATVGVLMEIPLVDGHVLTPRVDFSKMVGLEDSGSGYSRTTDFKHLDIGVDYQFFPSGQPRGFYLALGIANQKWTTEEEDTTLGVTTTDSDSASKIVPVVGLGWKWNSLFGMGLRHSSTKFGKASEDAFGGFTAKLTTLEFRFTF